MKTWTPLWSSILNSTIWSESKEVRLLWITMLAMKDMNGLVESSTVGLAKQAGLTLDETKEALRVLESPDTKSEQFQEYEGRRIERVENGWKVLNHLKYRDAMASLRRREQQKEWQRRYRAKQSPPVTGEASAQKMANAGATKEEVEQHAAAVTEEERLNRMGL